MLNLKTSKKINAKLLYQHLKSIDSKHSDGKQKYIKK